LKENGVEKTNEQTSSALRMRREGQRERLISIGKRRKGGGKAPGRFKSAENWHVLGKATQPPGEVIAGWA